MRSIDENTYKSDEKQIMKPVKSNLSINCRLKSVEKFLEIVTRYAIFLTQVPRKSLENYKKGQQVLSIQRIRLKMQSSDFRVQIQFLINVTSIAGEFCCNFFDISHVRGFLGEWGRMEQDTKEALILCNFS